MLFSHSILYYYYYRQPVVSGGSELAQCFRATNATSLSFLMGFLLSNQLSLWSKFTVDLFVFNGADSHTATAFAAHTWMFIDKGESDAYDFPEGNYTFTRDNRNAPWKIKSMYLLSTAAPIFGVNNTEGIGNYYNGPFPFGEPCVMQF